MVSRSRFAIRIGVGRLTRLRRCRVGTSRRSSSGVGWSPAPVVLVARRPDRRCRRRREGERSSGSSPTSRGDGDVGDLPVLGAAGGDPASLTGCSFSARVAVAWRARGRQRMTESRALALALGEAAWSSAALTSELRRNRACAAPLRPRRKKVLVRPRRAHRAVDSSSRSPPTTSSTGSNAKNILPPDLDRRDRLRRRRLS